MIMNTPGETLYVAMQDAEWHTTEYRERDYDELTAREQANFEYFAERVIAEHCVE